MPRNAVFKSPVAAEVAGAFLSLVDISKEQKSPVGASLLAIAVDHSPSMLPEPAPSRAGSLLQESMVSAAMKKPPQP